MSPLCLQSHPTVFSAGLDFAELDQPNHDRFVAFYRIVQEVFLKLSGSRLATVAAINVSKLALPLHKLFFKNFCQNLFDCKKEKWQTILAPLRPCIFLLA